LNKRITKIILILFASILFLNFNKKNNAKKQEIQEKKIEENKEILQQEEMRAVWVPFLTLDMKEKAKDEQEFKEKFKNIVETCKNYKLNTLIVHVRSHSDAMYNSKIFPWSHLISGTQGEDPGFDPLEFMIKTTHEYGLKFHAWINPFRIKVLKTPEKLSFKNPFFKLNKDLDIMNWKEDKYYNPASAKVREKIISGIKEIVENYMVDGIHLDDYFYPSSSPSLDIKNYENYCKNNINKLELPDFRMANINNLISGIYTAIKKINKNIEFGISPQANIKNDEAMAADVKTWASIKGYVDYLCPQAYVNFENKYLPFKKALEDWKAMSTEKSIKLYAGLGLYKAGSSADNNTWKKSDNIISEQIKLSRDLNFQGFVFYSYEYLNNKQTEREVKNFLKLLD